MKEARVVGRHRSPRLSPISMDQADFDKITAIAERINLPVAWVVRKLITESLAEVDMDNLPTNIFRR